LIDGNTSRSCRKGGKIGYLTQERAYELALRVTRTPGYNVVETRRAWSAMWAWHVEVHEHRTGARLLLLNEDQFDARLMMGAGQPTTGEITTAQTTAHAAQTTAHAAHTNERAAATSNS